ncbi:hypothetical protein PIROE2DRAFT_61788 [Piromyces sp. E2]|nr:hypothetical protein PIROE2DRAFT_61788 [Piromyces sp. E2]|eukprot:OUM62604.1 hypothetical protein PIROE2DRAFT_61788 [Piromyces sp. E2]
MEVNLHTFTNSSNLAYDYRSELEHLLKKGSDKYDIYFYDITYSTKYYEYFMDITDLMSEEQKSWYSTGVASQTCILNGRWVGLPVNINYRILYSNTNLLKKHKREIPTTWDELLETGKYILNKEKDEGNTDLIGYNGFIPEYETNLSSVEEFIYSYRDYIFSPYPDYQSDEAINALKKLKEIKNEISSVNSVYTKTNLVGGKNGLSGTTIGGYNIGINNNINKSHKRLAIEAFKFITSKATQKKYLIKSQTLSAIDSLYDDPEKCNSRRYGFEN